MKRKYAITVLTMMLLLLGSVNAQAETKDIQTEYAAITDENRFEEEYYQKPQTRYPAARHEMYRASKQAQDLEQYIVDALENYQSSIDVSAYQISINEASAVFFQILNNNPGIFYVDTNIRYSYDGQTKTILSYSVTYLGTPKEIDLQRQELETAAEQAAEQAEASMSDVEKALVVHDYLAQNCEYDYDRLINGQLPDISHTAYGALVNRIAVCDGYADAYVYIMKDKLGVPCELVTSDSMGHAWNIIQVGGKWYHVDATWDDPVRDCIGRVRHNYFLLSDTAVREKEHTGWKSTYAADSTIYDNAFWAEITSSILCYQGEWYYSRYQEDNSYLMGSVKLVKKDGLLNGTESEIYEESLWAGQGNTYYPVSCMYPIKVNEMIYFNTKTAVYHLDKEGTIEEVYKPQIPSGQWIFGFTVRGKEVWYALQSSPETSGKQVILTYMLPELDLPEITDISAEDVTAVYNGSAHRINVSGIQDGDVVQYAGADGVYQQEQPEMINAGTYQVRYQVKRRGYQPFEGMARVQIAKAVPTYTAPENLMGESGKTLASIVLPEGFAWQTDSGTKLYEEGNKVFLVTYTPEDCDNYEAVTDIEVNVSVSCPGHTYTSEVTKEPTATENGEETFTCTLCGHSYKAVIDASLPQIEGIEAENVKAEYNGEAQKISLKGLKAGDIVKYAGEDGGYREEQPEMINAGTYQVMYRIERQGFQPFSGTAEVEITKAIPKYTVPSGLKGESGKTLASIILPEGFSWMSPSATRLSAEGTSVWYVNYTPKDIENYEAIKRIEVKVTVKCPGHQYQSRVTRPAAEAQKGMKTYTCRLCGNSYTEDIPALSPKRPGNVSGLKVKKCTVRSLAFVWNPVEGAGYCLTLYQGNTLVSTQYVTRNYYTFNSLKAGKEYTLKVTPYRIVNGTRVFASATGKIKTAAAPGTVKMKSVKKNGKSKVKLAWKKVSGASGYEIFMKTGKGSFKKIETIAQGKKVSFAQTGLKKGTTYYFRVRAYKTVDKAKIYGIYSRTKMIKIR